MNLWKHQQEARYACNAMLNAKRNPLFVSPTGTGKTRTSVAITQDRISLKHRVFAVTPQVEIFKQWVDAYREAGINYGTINDSVIKVFKLTDNGPSINIANRTKMIYEAHVFK